MNKKILMIVDYQSDFVAPEGKLSVPQAIEIKENIQKMINSDFFDIKLVSFDTHPNKKIYEQTEEYKIYGFDIHCEYKQEGWWLYNINLPHYKQFQEIIKKRKEIFSMIKIENEIYFTKDKFDIWEGNDNFSSYIDNNIDKNDTIYIVGVATNYCVFANAMGFIKRGYKVKIISDSVKGIKDETLEKNINIMKNRDIKFITTKEIK